MTKWPVQKLAQGTTQKLLQDRASDWLEDESMTASPQTEMFIHYDH